MNFGNSRKPDKFHFMQTSTLCLLHGVGLSSPNSRGVELKFRDRANLVCLEYARFKKPTATHDYQSLADEIIVES